MIPMTAKQKDSFEAALAELEKLVTVLEKGDLPLEKTLEQFERGIALTRRCQQELQQAEQKVEILLQNSADGQPQDFDPQD